MTFLLNPFPFGPSEQDKSGEHVTILQSSDLDETRKLVSGIYCEHRLTQVTSNNPLNYHHLHIKGRQLGFSIMCYGADVRIDPGLLQSFYLVQIPLLGHDSLSAEGNKAVSHAGCASVHSPHHHLRMCWSADCKKLVVRIDKEALERHATSMIGDGLSNPIEFALSMDTGTGSGGSWARLVTSFVDELSQAPSILQSPLIAAQFEQMIMTSLLQWQPNTLWSMTAARSTNDAAPRYVRTVEEYIESHCHQPLALEDLVAVAGISGRSLFAAFKKYRNISPIQHLRNVRMQRAYRELISPCATTTVTNVAMRWGFFELGHFAAAYRKRFGESPSATLKRSR